MVEPGTLEMVLSVTEAAQGYPLSVEQRCALAAVVGNGWAVEVIEGAAGTGKTTLMRAARLVWEGQGYVVADGTLRVRSHVRAARRSEPPPPWPDVHRAWTLAQASLPYADAIYVAAAERHHTALLTTDTRIERSHAPMTCQIITITPPGQPHNPRQRP